MKGRPRPLRIGLTGGIGSGKSTVAAMLARRGATVVDTDAIARQLTAAGGAAMPALLHAFGDAISSADGALNREAMRTLAFSDPAAKQRLEALLHPLIGSEALRQAANAGEDWVIFDVPLLAESQHWRQRVDRVLVIDCSQATQIERVTRRPGWTRDSVERVMASQASRAARLAIADAVILNDGIDLAALQAEVDAVWHLWQRSTQDPVEQ
ncbi:MAG: dephospho-CoA kinase [Pseudomonadota bacterium]